MTTSLGHSRVLSHVTTLFPLLTILISDESTDEDESRVPKVFKLKKPEAKTPEVPTTVTAIDETAANLAWPWTCKYFVPHVMDASTGLLLIDQRSRYIADDQLLKQNLKYLDIGAADPQVREVLQDTRSATSVRDLLALSSLPSQHTRIFFLGARRHYNLPRETYCSFTTTAGTWRQILDAGNVPPSAVELLYDRNGGYWFFTTYCSNNKCAQSSSRSDQDTVCAYHIALKVSTWLGNECFLYARHDLHARNNFVLIAGTGHSGVMTHLQEQFTYTRPPHLFSVICAVTTKWMNDIASIGLEQDFATQQLESETGFSNRFYQTQPLRPDQLSLRKSLVITSENLHSACRASLILQDITTFLITELSEDGTYYLTSEKRPPRPFPMPRLEMQLTQQLRQRAVQLGTMKNQLQSLIRRVDAQWQITTALMSQHNTNLTMQMAKDSRNDSILVRRIAFVTIIFLPATFMATFFSMSFFHVSDGRLTVSKWIWLYVVCTLPLTFFLGAAYGDIRERWRRLWLRPQTKSNFEAEEK